MKPETYIGYGSIKHLGEVLLRYSAQTIFLVTGNKSFSLSGAEDILKPYMRSYTVSRFFGFAENPNSDDLQDGVNLFRKYKPDLILAIGGGSVIDMAKLVNVFSVDDIEVERQLLHPKKLSRCSKPLIAVPTTAGTGSEATQFAALYVDKRKYSVSHKVMLPDIAIVDPILTHKMSPKLTAVTGMDALSQAIESYWSVHSNEESKGYAREAIQIIVDQLQKAVIEPTEDSRLAMARASHLAGKAINITRTTAPHALSYALTSRFGVPHGQAVSLTLPSFMNFNYGVTEEDIVDPRGVAYVRRTLEEISDYLGCRTVQESSARVRKLMGDIGLATTFADLQIDEENAIKTVTREVNMERLMNNPRRITEIQVTELLMEIG